MKIPKQDTEAHLKEPDKLKVLSERLKDVAEKFKSLKESGVDEELLIVYIKHKTGLPRKKVVEMVKATEEFYDRLVGERLAEVI